VQDTLVISQYARGDVRIAWFLPSVEDEGATVGEISNQPIPVDLDTLVGKDEEETTSLRETYAVENAAHTYMKNNPSTTSKDALGYHWETETHARKALIVFKAALKMERTKVKPLADWEQKALAAGWKPPKGRLEGTTK
jgi:hypothetical protein